MLPPTEPESLTRIRQLSRSDTVAVLCRLTGRAFGAYSLLTTMDPSPKRVLVVSHDTMLRSTRPLSWSSQVIQ
jgi:hypothetical protein